MNKPAQHSSVTTLEKLRGLTFKTRAGAIASIVVVMGAALIYFFVIQGHPTKKAEPDVPTVAGTFRPSKGQLEALKIVPVQEFNFREEHITDGAIANNDDTTTPVFSPYSGRVTRLMSKLGDHVEKGTALMAVEASEYVQGQNDLVSALAAYKTAQAQVKLAETAEQRQHELLLSKAGAQKDWLQSQADLITAQGNARSADIALDSVRNRLRILGKTESEITALEVESVAHKMNPEALVRAPIAGTVILRQVGVGQNIQSAAAGSSNPVYSIANLSTVWLIGNVRETDVAQIKIGTPVEVNVMALPNRLFKAKINWIAPSIDPNTHRLMVRAEVDNRDGALKAQMFATFHLLTGNALSAPAVPQSAIVYEGAEAHVFVANKDGSLVLRNIKTGRINGDLVEATEGLKAGEKIVTSGALFIDRAAEGN